MNHCARGSSAKLRRRPTSRFADFDHPDNAVGSNAEATVADSSNLA
jgi:hypothetical protein